MGPRIEGCKDIPQETKDLLKSKTTKSLCWGDSPLNDRIYHLDQNAIVNFSFCGKQLEC